MKRKPLRLFMTADAVGGVWTYALDLACELSRHGVVTTLAVLGPRPDAEQKRAALAVPGLRLIETDLPLDWTATSTAEVRRTARAVEKLSIEAGADIVHLNTPALAAEAAFHAPVIGACHSCMATWWDAVRGGEMPEDFRWRTELLATGYRACDALVAPSNAFAEATGRTYGALKPVVVHNGRKAPAARRPERSDRVVFTAGRLWDDGKNVSVLDRAAARLDVPVFAAGPLAGPIGQRVSLSNIETLGSLNTAGVDYWMARARVFVSTALYEPFGLSVLEAAQAGCTLVLSDIPTFRELWQGAAVFVPPHDDKVLAEVIQALLDEPATAEFIGRAAQERAARYTTRAMGLEMLGLYQSLLPRAAEAAA